jgi:hypothetical protein
VSAGPFASIGIEAPAVSLEATEALLPETLACLGFSGTEAALGSASEQALTSESNAAPTQIYILSRDRLPKKQRLFIKSKFYLLL